MKLELKFLATENCLLKEISGVFQINISENTELIRVVDLELGGLIHPSPGPAQSHPVHPWELLEPWQSWVL